jgi:hypothetical protein
MGFPCTSARCSVLKPMVCRGGPFSGDGFDAVKLLSGRCGSSLLASAIRYTEVTKECVAVIVSHHGLVEFMTASEPFRSGGIAWLRRRLVPTTYCTRAWDRSRDSWPIFTVGKTSQRSMFSISKSLIGSRRPCLSCHLPGLPHRSNPTYCRIG